MKSQKIIGILIFLSIISSMFILGYVYSNNKQKNLNEKKVNGVKWSFNSSNSEVNINLSNEKIAPGSNGNFIIEIDATKAETDIFYKIKVNEEINIPKNFKFYAEIKDELDNILLKTEEYNSFSSLADTNLNGTILFDKQNQKQFIKIYWNWEFDNENIEEFINTTDYEFNNSNSLNCYYNIEIIGEQI